MKAGANAAARSRRSVQTLPEVTISEDSEVRFLHLTPSDQGSSCWMRACEHRVRLTFSA